MRANVRLTMATRSDLAVSDAWKSRPAITGIPIAAKYPGEVTWNPAVGSLPASGTGRPSMTTGAPKSSPPIGSVTAAPAAVTGDCADRREQLVVKRNLPRLVLGTDAAERHV